jgi:hypothetical protein
VNNRVGNVTSGNVNEFLDVTMRMLPITQASPDIHAVYVTSAPALESDDDNGAWGTILGELNALRVAEGSSRYYYGVVRTTYNNGVAGMGYEGWPAAVGWDFLPSGSSVAAHEWGHNWSLRHAPGCGATNLDVGFPYGDGKIGIWGMDVGPRALKSPSTYYDFMSYCGPEWISDYNYQAILNYRQANGAQGVSSASEPSLLIWGRVDRERVVLEPAFEVMTTPVLPSGSGEYTLEGLSSDGEPLFSFAFQPIAVADAGSGERHFAFALPLRSFSVTRLARIRVSGGGGLSASRERPVGPELAEGPEPRLSPMGDAGVELTWDGIAFPMALVRDPGTGEILSFARGGRIRLSTAPSGLEIFFSDGIRTSEVIRIPPR